MADLVITSWSPRRRATSSALSSSGRRASLPDALSMQRGHGDATEAVGALLRWAFDTLDLNRVQAESYTRNEASARVLKKLGFLCEGTLREDCVVHGEASDSWVYGLIRQEWRPSS
jgi:hypothetical protein